MYIQIDSFKIIIIHLTNSYIIYVSDLRNILIITLKCD